MSNKPRLSICMIVKNEAELLPACLASIQAVADQIIVVDTGSSDGTIEIAKQYGAHVETIEWKHHFGEARNQALALAAGEWILSLDADERLCMEDAMLLRSLLESSSDYEGWFIQVEHYLSDEVGAVPVSINPLLRLFRNRPSYRFEGAIHEQIAPVILREKPDSAFGISSCRIRHVGYQPHIVASKNKIKRNIELLEQTIQQEGREPFHLFNLAVEKLRQGSIEDALHLLIEAKATTPAAATFAHLLVKYEAMAFAALGRYDEAIASCISGLRHYPDYSDLYYALAHYQDAKGLRQDAIASLKQAIAIGPPPNHYHTESGLATYRSHTKLASWALESRQWHEAAAALELALSDFQCPASTWLAAYRLQQLLQDYPSSRSSVKAAPLHGAASADRSMMKSTKSSDTDTCSVGEGWYLQQSEPRQQVLRQAAANMLPLDHGNGSLLDPTGTAQSDVSEPSHYLAESLRHLRLADGALARMQRYSLYRERVIAARLVLPIGATALSQAELREKAL
ncbi:glycosyltransferase family 2 protein [Paenibacillus sp. 1001270B_150601_E10]|uniref:glycosyltransferase family 2 protein n=1 Tax=Paenibacillus sp. 1001270B_150601_E10 TaxID=2787079 RepID=UPI00189F7D46|nr:glycosyltransferase family 2 protein [Paenibacillus sp. 1001270B_150601_E10]